jgi:hypothetical protein
MCSVGPVRPDPPEDLLAPVQELSRVVDHEVEDRMKSLADLRVIQKRLCDLEERLSGVPAVTLPPPGRVGFRIDGRRVHLTPTLAQVLVAMAGNRTQGPKAVLQRIDAIQASVKAARKRPIGRRALIQAVYRLRREFVRAGLRADQIASEHGQWRLDISEISLANIRESRSDA